MKAISHLTYELSMLAKAVPHRNLSLAAVHVGLSQPQLSRLIQKLEAELKVVLLDRSSRRKSGWTQVALDLTAAFHRGLGRLEAEVMSVTRQADIDEVRIGTLEGLAPIAMSFAQQFFQKMHIRRIELDVLEYRDLDSLFMSGQLDLIFTARSPSKQKFKYSLEVGYQQNEQVSTDKNFLVLSPFEWTQAGPAELEGYGQYLVSNSLQVRSKWLQEFGGTGTLPVDAKRGKGKGYYSVYLLGNDLLSGNLWEQIEGVAKDF
jgi:DNA-binding transcriptional LysR family regulator